MTDFSASTIRYQSTPLTLMVTLSRVIVSCCSADTVRVRMSTRTERSMFNGMIQYRPGPRGPPAQRPTAETCLSPCHSRGRRDLGKESIPRHLALLRLPDH